MFSKLIFNSQSNVFFRGRFLNKAPFPSTLIKRYTNVPNRRTVIVNNKYPCKYKPNHYLLLKGLHNVNNICQQRYYKKPITKDQSFPYNTVVMAKEEESNVSDINRKNEKQYTEILRDFLNPGEFYNTLLENDLDTFYGVPDSLLKDFCAYVDDHTPQQKHVIAANEGSAIALASGYHLATGKHSVVYLQNSGLGNIVNPLLSLADPEVYRIPMLIFVGWRGEPGKKDEPQHLVQGKATPSLLASLNIPFQTLPDYQEGAEKTIKSAKNYLNTHGGPFVILVRRQTFLPYKGKNVADKKFEHTRESAMKLVVDNISEKDCVVSTTGMLSRELFEYRAAKEQGHGRDFLMVGSMGYSSSIALGIAVNKPQKNVYCLDGDGSVIMHMGALATISHVGPKNLKHIIINNGAHDSVGGQSTKTLENNGFSFTGIAKSCGYTDAFVASTTEAILEKLNLLKSCQGPALLEIQVNTGSRKNLGRPTRTTIENKKDFMDFLQKES